MRNSDCSRERRAEINCPISQGQFRKTGRYVAVPSLDGGSGPPLVRLIGKLAEKTGGLKDDQISLALLVWVIDLEKGGDMITIFREYCERLSSRKGRKFCPNCLVN